MMKTADIKAMDTANLFDLQVALNAKYVANKVVDIVLRRKIDAKLEARFC